ncbi:MAG: peptide deformylase [bacterium]|nr:MAG: peptide deformylase [bacterium]
MPVLPILTYPDPILRLKCEEAVPGTDDVCRLAEDMVETMYAAPGIGLAAPQVGRNIRMLVIDITGPVGAPEPHVLLNPVIQEKSESTSFEEGCLSVPELNVEIDRARKIRVRYQDLDGRWNDLSAEDLFAVAVQHEMDHLEGRLILDYASPVRRDLYRRKIRKQRAQGV